MSGGWEGSDRRERLPDNWAELRIKRLIWDQYRCTWRLPSGRRCPRRATEVDHRVNNDDDSITNLRSLCPHHHAQKSSREGAQAKQQARDKGKRPPERHPGERR